jgi:hypothetical protein
MLLGNLQAWREFSRFAVFGECFPLSSILGPGETSLLHAACPSHLWPLSIALLVKRLNVCLLKTEGVLFKRALSSDDLSHFVDH